MFILLAWKNLKIAVPMHEVIQIWLKPKQKTDSLWSSRVIVYKILVSCYFMLNYAAIALLGNLCYRRWQGFIQTTFGGGEISPPEIQVSPPPRLKYMILNLLIKYTLYTTIMRSVNI